MCGRGKAAPPAPALEAEGVRSPPSHVQPREQMDQGELSWALKGPDVLLASPQESETLRPFQEGRLELEVLIPVTGVQGHDLVL